MTNTQNINYAKFKVSDVLDEPIAGNVDIQKKDISDEGEIVVTSGLTDYGIKGRTTRKAKVVKEPSITIDMFGNVFYRDEPYKLVTHGRVYGFTSKLIKNREIGLYLVSALRPLGAKFSYNNMMTWSKLKDLSIELPVTPLGTPDFEYMEERIRELEEERIRELEAYLKVTGLSDATLTDEEQMALNKMNNGGITWKKFKLGDILDFTSIRQAKSQSAIPTDDNKSTRVPYIVQSTKNNMFRRNVNKQYLIDHDEPIIKGNCVALGVTLPAVSYQPDEFGGSQLIVARSKWLNNKTGLFLATAIKKQMYQFSYSHKPGMRIYKALDIDLPVTPAGDIDFDFMETYITAIEKQSIRGVIEYKDKVIQTIKDVVNAN